MGLRQGLAALSRKRRRYAALVPIGRRPTQKVWVVRHQPELDRYVGKWVAIRDGHVVTFADSSAELADRLRKIRDGGSAVMRYVAPEAHAYIVGVG